MIGVRLIRVHYLTIMSYFRSDHTFQIIVRMRNVIGRGPPLLTPSLILFPRQSILWENYVVSFFQTFILSSSLYIIVNSRIKKARTEDKQHEKCQGSPFFLWRKSSGFESATCERRLHCIVEQEPPVNCTFSLIGSVLSFCIKHPHRHWKGEWRGTPNKGRAVGGLRRQGLRRAVNEPSVGPRSTCAQKAQARILNFC
jgi:hypothetical protein